MRFWPLLLALAAVAGCNNPRTPGDVDVEVGSTPTGSISGQLFSVAYGPLAGATVQLQVPGRSTTDGGPLETTTNENGEFVFEAVPAQADALVTMRKAGYAEQVVSVRIAATAGNKPISNANALVGPFTLTRLTGTVKARVFTARGYPARNTRVQLDVLPTAGLAEPELAVNYPHGYPVGRMVTTATTDDMGLVTFTNVPEPLDVHQIFPSTLNYVVTVPAIDETGDGIPDSAGTTRFFAASSFITDTTPPFIRLQDANYFAPFGIVRTNVPSLVPGASGSSLRPSENLVKQGEPIVIAFGQAVAAATVRLTDETGTRPIPSNRFTQTLSAGNTLLLVTPQSTEVTVGQEYNIAVHAVSQETGAVLDALGYFFVGAVGTSQAPTLRNVAFKDLGTPGDAMLNAGEQLDANFSVPLGFYAGFANFGPRIAYFNRDLDSSGIIGDSAGEKGYDGPGFEVRPREFVNETGTSLVLKESGYTTRWSIFYTGGVAVPISTQVSLEFGRILDPTVGVQTVSGQPVNATFTVDSMALAP
jgi:hypothetical protein